MRETKKIIIGCLAVALVAALAIGGSLAYLTDSEEKDNVFAVGDLDITLKEPNWDEEKGLDLRPGSTLDKDPTVVAVDNDSYMRVYVSYIDNNDMMPNPAYVDDATTPLEPKEIANTNKGKLITDTARLALIKDTIFYDKTYVQGTGSGVIDNTVMYSEADLTALTDVNKGINDTDYSIDVNKSVVGKDCYRYDNADAEGIFKEGTNAILFTNIIIPTDWNQEDLAILGKYKIVVYAQAIQDTGFADADAAFAALDAEETAGTILKDHETVTP